MLTVNYQANENIVKSALEREFTDTKVKAMLDKYLKLYEREYTNITHKEYVQLFITGLVSNLGRKSIEPITQH